VLLNFVKNGKTLHLLRLLVEDNFSRMGLRIKVKSTNA